MIIIIIKINAGESKVCRLCHPDNTLARLKEFEKKWNNFISSRNGEEKEQKKNDVGD